MIHRKAPVAQAKCQQLPGSWVHVPGDSDYNTEDFCVMKYEASNSAGVALSAATGLPWSDISLAQAVTQCAALGQGYHLMTNAEWMTIATNAAAVADNWSGGAVGSGFLYRGHSDADPLAHCQADLDDTKAYVEGDCTPRNTININEDDLSQKRTLVLASGMIIWDLSGNLREWIDYTNLDDKPSPLDDWLEYPEVSSSASMNVTDLIPTNAVKAFWNDSWNSAQFIGSFFPGLNGEGGGFRRGGSYLSTRGGLFSGRLDKAPEFANEESGFRCVIKADP